MIRSMINDKDPVGILITCVYAFALVMTSITTYSVFKSERRAILAHVPDRVHGRWKFWLAMAVLVLLLGVNKQLDLQTSLTNMFRSQFRERGIYQDRREYQAVFVAILGVIGVAAIAWILWLLKSVNRSTALAMFGAVILIAFILFRAVSFHHVDTLLRLELNAWRVGWLIEISGILVICAASIWELARRA
jgi:hypothetical protein